MSAGGRAIPWCCCLDFVDGSEWQAIAPWRRANLPRAYNETIDGLIIGTSAGSCGTAAYRAEQVIVPTSRRSFVDRFSRSRFGAFAPRVLVHADLFLRRQSDGNVCHVPIVSHAAQVRESKTRLNMLPISRGSLFSGNWQKRPDAKAKHIQQKRDGSPIPEVGHGRRPRAKSGIGRNLVIACLVSIPDAGTAAIRNIL